MKKALVAPLFWGLGHATRCIPIIQGLLDNGFEVIIGSDSDALRLLKIEFPNLKAIELPAYDVTYGSENMFSNLISQMPRLIQVIRKEKFLIENIVEENEIDVILSDNRFGCYSNRCKCVFITHQIQIQTGYRVFD